MVYSYKSILKNIIEMNVDYFVEEKTGGKIYCVEQKIELYPGDKNFMYPTFNSFVNIAYQDYKIHGYIDNYGKVNIVSVYYEEKTIVNFDTENERTKTNRIFVYGDDLNDFKFKLF